MDDNKMKRNIKETFDTQVPDVLSKIKASPDFRIPVKKSGFSLSSLFSKRAMLTFTSVFVLLFVFALGFARNNYVIASTVTLELNPSVEFSLNRQDYVVKVTALNDDGVEVIEQDVNYRGLTIDQALEIVVKRLNDLGYIVTTDDINNIILIDVEGRSDKIKERVQTAFQTKLDRELEKYNKSHWVFQYDDFKLSDEQQRLIRKHDLLQKMSATKLALIFRINTLDESYSIQSLSRMTVRDLYDLYLSVESQDNLPHRDKMPKPRKESGAPHTYNSEVITF